MPPETDKTTTENVNSPIDMDSLKKLVQETISTALADNTKNIYKAIDDKNSGLASSILKTVNKRFDSLAAPTLDNKDVDTETPPVETPPENKQSDSTKLTLKALETQQRLIQQKVEDAERKFQEAQEKLKEEKISNQLNSVFSQLPVTDFNAAKILFQSQGESNIKYDEETGQVFYSQGNDVLSLSEAANKFLDSPLGQAVKKIPKGSGLAIKETPINSNKSTKTLNERIFTE
jgi:hypothetical protein